MRRRDRQSAVWAWLVLGLLLLSLAVSGTIEHNDEVQKFKQEWRAIPCDNGEVWWVRSGFKGD